MQNYIDLLLTCQDDELESIFNVLSCWIWQKGDFFHWISVLNRIDAIYERIVKEYQLPKQVSPLKEKDQKLIVSSLQFVKTLWENATNKAIYASYDVIITFI